MRTTGAVEIDWGAVIPASSGNSSASSEIKLSKGALIAAGAVFIAACGQSCPPHWAH